VDEYANATKLGFWKKKEYEPAPHEYPQPKVTTNMTEDQAVQSEQPNPDKKSEPLTLPPPSAKPNYKIWIRKKALDCAIVLFVVLPIGWAFEQIAGEKLEHLMHVQEYVYKSVSSLSPLELLDDVSIGYRAVHDFLANVLLSVFSVGFVDSESIQEVLGIFSFMIAMVALPITVLIHGSFLGCILVLGVYLPLAYMLSDGDGGFFGIIIALGITMLFFWLVQLLMLGALAIFGHFIHAVQLWVGTSLFGTASYWCLARSTEHSIAERVAHSAGRLFRPHV
jgi:hypothetical protein